MWGFRPVPYTLREQPPRAPQLPEAAYVVRGCFDFDNLPFDVLRRCGFRGAKGTLAHTFSNMVSINIYLVR